jgi:hypothetical protein
MREWVVSGMEDPIPWTEESERQFRIAEEATMAVAKTYNDGGFAVAIDHCRNPKRMDELAHGHLRDYSVAKVLLLPDLDTNLKRNAARTDKNFDPAWLEDVIRFTNENYRNDLGQDWILVNNSDMSVEATLDSVLLATGKAHSDP